jgi:kumamolisin
MALAAALLLAGNAGAQSESRTLLTRHVRKATLTGEATLISPMDARRLLRLDIVLALRDPDGLKGFLADIYDPASPNYHRYITPAGFAGRFGPSQQDYDAVLAFARTNGFTVVGGSHEGMEVQVEGTVAAIERAFHVKMGVYQHPTEARTFYAPDREPTADLPFALWHITGLDNFSVPRPMRVSRKDYAKAHGIAPEAVVSHATTGSGPGSSFLGSDMRSAYYGGTLTGAGQNLGLFEYLGTDLADLNTYYKNVGQTLPLTPVLLSTDGTNTSCVYSQAGGHCDDGEQNLDMTQALGMAPGLASLWMYIGSLDTAIISAMTVTTNGNPLPTTIGCSWGWTPADPTTLDPYFQKMAAQGQTFFAAAGDNSTWSSGNEAWPADDAYVVSVGGTDLVTTGAGGAWKSETAWIDGGGGISPDQVAIPSWQALTGVITSTNKGSATYRNGPDVAANANFTFYTCDDQKACQANVYGGTSFAAPMWAAYVALANEQAVKNGNPRLGFINPLLYPLGLGSSYATNFHDITSGSSGTYSANTGYDLVTGWGSPNGAALLTTLSGPIVAIAPTSGTSATSFAASLNYPSYDGTATFTATGTSGTASPLGTCTISSSTLSTCSYPFAGTKLGPGLWNITGSLAWVEYGTTTETTSAATSLLIQDTTTLTATPTSSSFPEIGGSTSVQITVADANTASLYPPGVVTLKLQYTTLGSCTLVAGTCSVTVQGSQLFPGANSIVVSYPGVSNAYTAASQTMTLTAVPPATSITFTSVSHDFGQVAVGTPAAAYGVSLTNSASTAYPFVLNFTPSSGFTSATNCPASLASGKSCEIVFYFTPTSTSDVSATWSLVPENGFTYGPSNGGTLVGSGTLTGGLSLTTKGYNFGTVAIGTTSGTYGTVLSNSTSSAATLTLGSVSAPFTSITNCGATLAAGASCNLDFTFTPISTAAQSQSFAIAASVGGAPVTITTNGAATSAIVLTGTGGNGPFAAYPASSTFSYYDFHQLQPVD